MRYEEKVVYERGNRLVIKRGQTVLEYLREREDERIRGLECARMIVHGQKQVKLCRYKKKKTYFG